MRAFLTAFNVFVLLLLTISHYRTIVSAITSTQEAIIQVKFYASSWSPHN